MKPAKDLTKVRVKTHTGKHAKDLAEMISKSPTKKNAKDPTKKYTRAPDMRRNTSKGRGKGHCGQGTGQGRQQEPGRTMSVAVTRCGEHGDL